VSAVPFVSVVIPVHNGAATLGEVLDGLGAQTYPGDRFEVIVVDNRSTDASAEVAASRGATVLREDDVQSAAAARNRGIAAARGDVVAFLDADCTQGPDWLAEGVRALEEAGADLAGGRVDTRAAGADWLAHYDRLTYMRQAERIEALGLSASACLFVRREALERIGPFRPELVAAEDDAFCLRARGLGLSIAYAPEARVCREAPASAGAVLRRHFRAGRAEAALARDGLSLPRSGNGGAVGRRLAYARRVWADRALPARQRLAVLFLNAAGALAQAAGRWRGRWRGA
jgi:glycosyltransferase involved in cell wall biosynthesis